MTNLVTNAIYIAFNLILIAAMLVVRKDAVGLVRWKDVLGLVIAIQLMIGGFIIINQSPKTYLIIGAVLCAVAAMLMLYKNLHHHMTGSILLITIGGLFASWPGFIGYNLYYLLNTKAIDDQMKKDTSEKKAELDSDDRD